MKDIVQNEKKAIELRREGRSYQDIANVLKVSKASVCGWVKNVRLTESEKELLHNNLEGKMKRGRMKASITLRAKSVFKEKVSYETAEKEFEKYVKDSFFNLGLGMCPQIALKKGSSSFQFATSNPQSMKLMLAWLKKYTNITKNQGKYRLFVANSYKNEGFEDFWARTLGISRDSFQKTVYSEQYSQKTKEYKGSLCLVISKIELVRKVVAWQKLTIRYYGDVS